MSRGFGLSEALVAVAAVALIGAIALPLISRDKTVPARTACLSNMKQIGASVSMYALDFDDVLPVTTERKPRLGFGRHWSALVQPYLKSAKMFVCPGDPEPAHAQYKDRAITGQVSYLSYINNYAAIPAHDFYPVPRSVLTAPEQLILLGERRTKTYLLGPLPAWKGTSGFFPGQPCREKELGSGYRKVNAAEARSAVDRATHDDQVLMIRLQGNMHGPGSNYTFADGHAVFETLERTLDPRDFQWGERFYPRSKPDADCDGRIRKKTPGYLIPPGS
jgi:prepilin-type processing-associated H-X9-DG protein